MANKSIIDIEVNDEQFKAFHEIYQKFQEKIASMPEASKAAFIAVEKGSKKAVDGAAKMTKELEKSTKAQRQFRQSTNDSEKSMSKLVKTSEKLSKNIFGIGKFLMKMGTIGAGFGIAGLFGLNALGNAAVSGQRQARGLGLNQGQVRAFQTDFGRYLSPNILSTMASAQADFQKRAYLSLAAGVSYQQAGTMTADQLAIKTAMRAHEWWNKTPAEMRTQQSLQAAGFGQIGYSMEDMRRLGNTPMSELQTAQRQYQRNAGQLAISDKTTQAWYQLTRRVRLAGQTIEKVLINKLSALAPSIGNLITAFTDDVSALINGITPQEMNAFVSGIKSAAEYLGSKQTLENIQNFMAALGNAATFINKWFGNEDPFKDSVLNKQASKEGFGNLTSDQLKGIYSGAGVITMPVVGKDGKIRQIAFDKQFINKTNLSSSTTTKHEIKKAVNSYSVNPAPINEMSSYVMSSGNNKSTERYIDSVIKRLNDSKKIDLRIENKTGSNLFISTNAAAH